MTESATATAPPAPVKNEGKFLDTTGANGYVSTQSLPSPRIAIQPDTTVTSGRRPSLASHISAPAAQQYPSPMRQHRRTPSQHREVKETLNAKSQYTSDDAEGTKLKINQYIVKEEIGRGSYGAVHLATDQFGNEYAIKEFSKTRLRKRAQSNILKRPHGARPGRFPPGQGMRSPWSSHIKQLNNQDAAEAKDALFLIREEIAIMKKLNHPNLVQLIEVLDDPEEDSLYMVLEMCKKGVVMKVGLEDQADPYSEEQCRHWFRDLILGIEYLHAQGVVHRDIKPDNLLLTEDDILKIVDFGVSEMFEKPDQMMTAKSAGSPAFLPPELCIAKHGDVSGKAADVWSMGVSLYCLKYGKLPFKRDNVLEMYEAIRTEDPSLPPDENPDFVDLMIRLLDKDPNTRICMSEIRDHAWVTKEGTDTLLSEEENCSELVEPPNELEVNHAFTRRMSHLLYVMMAIRQFKRLITKSRSSTPELRTPRTAKTLEIPGVPEVLREPEPKEPWPPKPRSPEEQTEGRWPHKSIAKEAEEIVAARKAYLEYTDHLTQHTPESGKGQAHDPTDVNLPFLGIGTGGQDEFSSEPPADVVSDSPTGIDFDVYDRAFETEIERIRSASEKQGNRKMTYLTRLVHEKERYVGDECMVVEAGHNIPKIVSTGINRVSSAAGPTLGHLGLLAHREPGEAVEEGTEPGKFEQKKSNEGFDGVQAVVKEKGQRFADLVTATMQGVLSKKSGRGSEAK